MCCILTCPPVLQHGHQQPTSQLTLRREKYHVLEKFEVQAPDDQLNMLDAIEMEWHKFQVCQQAATKASCFALPQRMLQFTY